MNTIFGNIEVLLKVHEKFFKNLERKMNKVPVQYDEIDEMTVSSGFQINHLAPYLLSLLPRWRCTVTT